MQAYNPNATCPKCGSEDIDTQFRQTKQAEDAVLDGYSWGEFLRRDCQNCGYAWGQMTVAEAQKEIGRETKRALQEAIGDARAEAAMEALKTVSPEGVVDEEAPVPA